MVTPFDARRRARPRRRPRASPATWSTPAATGSSSAAPPGESPTTTDEEKSLLVGAVVDAVGDRARVVAGRRHQRHPAHAAPGRAGGRRRRTRPAGGDAVLLQAARRPGCWRTSARWPTPPTCRSCCTTSPAGPGCGSAATSCSRSPSTPACSRSRRPPGTCSPAPWSARRPGSRTTRVTTRSTSPGSRHGAVGVVSVVGHVAPREYADMVEAVGKNDLGTARELHVRLLPAVRGRDDPHPGRADGQGRACSCKACSPVAPCGRRCPRRPTTRSRCCAPTSRPPGCWPPDRHRQPLRTPP